MLINSWKNIYIKIYNNDKLIFYFVYYIYIYISLYS